MSIEIRFTETNGIRCWRCCPLPLHRRDVRYECECIKTVSMTPIRTVVHYGSEVTVHRHRDA